MTELWSHQRQMIDHAKQNNGGFWFVEMRLGKTRAAITWAIESNFKSVLVICPKSAGSVWESEVRSVDASFVGFIQATDGPLKARADAVALLKQNRATAFFVVNFEAFWRQPLWKAIGKVKWDAVIVDEAHRIGGAGSKQSRAAYAIGKRSPNRLALTGTPFSRDPLAVYGIARFVDDEIFGTRYADFESRYSNFITPSGARYHITLSYKNMDEFKARLQTKAISMKAADVIEVQPVTHLERYCTLTPKAQKFYKTLKKEMIAEWDSDTMTVKNVVVKSLRLHQLTGGFLDHKYEEPQLIDRSKLELLSDVLDEIDPAEDLVIFARYTAEIQAIKKMLSDHELVYELSGSKNELELWKQPNKNDLRKILVVQVDTGAEAIDLTKARYAIYYSRPVSGTKFSQSMARIGGPIQKRQSVIIQLICRGTIDEAYYKALIEHKKLETEILKELGIKDDENI